ncbi:MAG: hypothetical protein HFJ16_10525, partial [Romboutsia sp.]|nr:hypothetical protein [Romboutsia sp.]
MANKKRKRPNETSNQNNKNKPNNKFKNNKNNNSKPINNKNEIKSAGLDVSQIPLVG